MSSADKGVFNNAKAWPFAEARNLVARLDKMGIIPSPARPLLFETGYGPSGLPHIGTFGEVVRTSMVRKAYEAMTGYPTRLICFSDDMDGLRKVPDNIPNKDMVSQHLGKALTDVPDPFGEYDSFGAHNNARLQGFLDGFGFQYEFYSATQCYQSGLFNAALLNILKNYDAITNVILPTLGAERRENYSPFMPICPETRQVLQAKVTGHDADAGMIEYIDPRDGAVKSTSVIGGHCKLQWKCDWAMRWFALGVDYEMSGKDLSESVVLSSKITKIMGGVPPEGISYELFLDENGEKISKSKGNGLSVEDWLKYGTPDALSLFMYNQPKRAKRLFFDVIPKMVDEYYAHLGKYADSDDAAKIDNPLWHIHAGTPPPADMPASFTLLLNLAGVCQAETSDVVWGYLTQYMKGISPKSHPELDRLVGYAVAYYQTRVHPFKAYRAPTDDERKYLQMLDAKLGELGATAAATDIQSAVFAVGVDAGYEPLREWFSCLYQVLLGQNEGPRMGSFIQLYGIDKTRQLIASALDDRLQRG